MNYNDFYKNNATAVHEGHFQKKWYHVVLAHDDRYSTVAKKLNELLLNKQCKILDIACGTGIYERMLDPEIRKQQYIIGVDISQSQVEFSNGVFDEVLIHNIEQKLPYDSKTCDVIILSEIIEHLFEPEHIIEECYRLLKKWWLLIMTTPNISSIQNRLSFALFGNSKEIDYLWNKQHIRFFSKKTLKKLFSKYSLEYSRWLGCLYFYWNHFPIFIPIPLFLQKIFSFIFPNSWVWFFRIYSK